MSELSNAVFISYRREVGGILAMALDQHLRGRGVDVFYDIESLRAGKFGPIILDEIAARPYFLLVLTPGTLERCVSTGDWLRQEIEQAVATERMIVPVHTPSFDFDELERFLPGGPGETVRGFNAQPLPQKWFKYAVNELVEEFLTPRETAAPVVSAADRTVLARIRQKAQIAPTVTSVELFAQEHFERAYARAADDFAAQIADYNEAIRLYPEYGRAFYNRALARYRQGDLAGAIADCNETLRLDPEDAEALIIRGNVRANMDDPDRAIDDYNEAIRLNPESAVAFNNRGNARYAKDDRDGALADYDEALRLDPDYVDALNNRGYARRWSGDLPGAISDLERSLRLTPHDLDVQRRLAEAKKRRGVSH